MKPSAILLEICAGSVTSALAAQGGGADRVELCDNLSEGGTTPSYATIAKTRELLKIPLYPIIRPRGGDFLYSELEYELICRDIEICKQLGCDGVVIGMLRADGKVNKPAIRQLVELAWPLGVTFHRAFDMAVNPFEALEDIIQTGCERILTSGQRNTAAEGAELIAQLIHKADDRIIIMAGSGIQPKNIGALVKKTGASEFHATARNIFPSNMQYRNPLVSMSKNDNDAGLLITDANIVKELRRAAVSHH